MLKFFSKSDDTPKVKFDKEWNSYVVVRKGSILYTGTKEQCQTYLQNLNNYSLG